MTTTDYLESLQEDLNKINTILELEEGTNFTNIANMVESGDITKGGGQVIPTSLYELNNEIIRLRDSFADVLSTIPETYEVDTDTPITLYTPDENCKYYAIEKLTSGVYRVFWTDQPVLALANQNIGKPRWSLNYSASGSSNTIKEINASFSAYYGNINAQYYYSANYTTLDECLTKFKANELTYTSYSGNGMGISNETNAYNKVPYSNIVIIDGVTSSSSHLYTMTPKKISSNETIVAIE